MSQQPAVSGLPDPNLQSVCPLPLLLDIPTGSQRALVFAAHADDETLGCGGTMARLVDAGWRVHVVVVSDGAGGDPLAYTQGEVVAVRRAECRAALTCLGVPAVEFLDAPDGRLPLDTALLERLGDCWRNTNPDWVLAPCPLDYHRDHVHLGLLLLRLWQQQGHDTRLFCYEVWLPLPANWLVDIAPVMARKIRAINAYRLPLRYYPYDRMTLALNRFRGLQLGANGPEDAEALLEITPTTLASWSAVFINARTLLD
ncbi:MAG: PIG-L family deacetylase [Pseudomonadota bacterium]